MRIIITNSLQETLAFYQRECAALRAHAERLNVLSDDAGDIAAANDTAGFEPDGNGSHNPHEELTL